MNMDANYLVSKVFCRIQSVVDKKKKMQLISKVSETDLPKTIYWEKKKQLI